jgi:hypothetical protein
LWTAKERFNDDNESQKHEKCACEVESNLLKPEIGDFSSEPALDYIPDIKKD